MIDEQSSASEHDCASDRSAIGAGYSAQGEGVGCFHRHGAIQRAWISVGSPLPGVQTVCCTHVPA